MESSEQAEWDELYKWTGILFLRFARIECHLNTCLRFNLSWKIDSREWTNRAGFAAAVYGAQRFKASKDTILRVLKEEGRVSKAQIAAIKAVFEHLGHIAALRDKLAHQVTTWNHLEPGNWLISDSHTTRELRNANTWQFPIAALKAACGDISRAVEWLGAPNASGTLLKNTDEMPPAWRYKPSELRRLTSERVRALRESPPPPQSSQA